MTPTALININGNTDVSDVQSAPHFAVDLAAVGFMGWRWWNSALAGWAATSRSERWVTQCFGQVELFHMEKPKLTRTSEWSYD